MASRPNHGRVSYLHRPAGRYEDMPQARTALVASDTLPYPPSAKPRRPDLPSLTTIRALAALVVFAYHLHPWSDVPWLRPLQYGYAGVTLFFVLSGFILTWTYDPGQTRTHFLIRRLARIYPTYVVVLAAVVLWSLVSGKGRDPFAVLTNITLIHAWFTDPAVYAGINGVTWSLSCEIFFYALFPALWRLIRDVPFRWVAWALGATFTVYTVVVISVVTQPATRDLLQVLYANPLVRLPEFVMGVVAARLVIEGRRMPSWLTATTVGFAAAGALFLPQWPAANVWTAPLAAGAIIWLARRDLRRTAAPKWTWPQFAGRASYAFYLVHGLVLLRLEHSGLGSRAAIGLGVSAVAAVLLHLTVEVPAGRRITALLKARPCQRPSKEASRAHRFDT